MKAHIAISFRVKKTLLIKYAKQLVINYNVDVEFL